MLRRRGIGVGALVAGAVLLSAGLASAQLSLDRVQRVQRVGSDQAELALHSWEGGRAGAASREVLQSLPASYFESAAEAEENDADYRRRREAARRDQFVVNLIVVGCLAISFGLGLAITIVTLRKRSSRALPQRLF